MLRRFKSFDCPDADGRTPLSGECKWTLSIPLEGGMDYLEVEIGAKGREAIKAMLCQEDEETGRCPAGQHEWTGQQLGGPPDMAESYEWVAYCKKCGAEKMD